MTKRIPLLLIAVLLSGGLAQSAEQTADLGWFKERDTVLAGIKTIAILPATVEVATPNAESAAALIEEELAGKIAELGVEVLPASVYRELSQATKVALGGYYDPYTGEVIEEKLRSINDLTYREFERLHDFQAYFRPMISVNAAFFSYNTATWHGVEEPVSGKTGWFAGTDGYGRVPAISLIGVMFSRDETTYFGHPGGIQLARLVSGNDFSPVAPELLLVDEAKLINAVNLVTAPLLTPTLQPEAAKALAKQQKKDARKARKKKKNRNTKEEPEEQ